MNNKWGDGVIMDMYLGINKAKSRAEGTNLDGTPAYRNLRMRTFTYSTVGGYNFMQTELLDVGAIMAFDLNTVKMYTNSSASLQDDLVQDDVSFGVGLGAKAVFFPLKRILPLSVFGQAYYMFDFLPSWYDNLNMKINQATYMNDNIDDLRGNFSNLNIRLGVSLTIFSKKQEAKVKLEQKEGTKTKKTTSGFN